MTPREGAPARAGRGRQALFAAVLLAVLWGAVEAGSFGIWRLVVAPGARANVEALLDPAGRVPRLLPNTFWHHALNAAHPDYRELVNAQGVKGEPLEIPKPAGELRVVCLGDSTVEESDVPPAETFSRLLEQRLRGNVAALAGHSTVKVLNAGIGSHNSAFNLAHLAFRLIHYQPDVLVVKSAYNDYLPFLIPGMGVDYTHAFPKPFTLAESPSAFWWAARYSFALRIAGVALFREEVANPFRDFSGHLTAEQFRRMDFSANAGKFAVYAENLRSMVLLARGRGIRVIFLDLPTSGNPAHYGQSASLGVGFRSLVRRLEEELRRVAREEGVPFVETGLADADFRDHCHTTVSGNRKIAERLEQAVLATLGAPAASRP